jgi:hypothetical protein
MTLLSYDHGGITGHRNLCGTIRSLIMVHKCAHAYAIVEIRTGLRGLDMNIRIPCGEPLLHAASIVGIGEGTHLDEVALADSRPACWSRKYVHPDVRSARADHAKDTRGLAREIDLAPLHVRTVVVDGDLDRAIIGEIGNQQVRPEWKQGGRRREIFLIVNRAAGSPMAVEAGPIPRGDALD